jgi:hypothetical protein
MAVPSKTKAIVFTTKGYAGRYYIYMTEMGAAIKKFGQLCDGLDVVAEMEAVAAKPKKTYEGSARRNTLRTDLTVLVLKLISKLTFASALVHELIQESDEVSPKFPEQKKLPRETGALFEELRRRKLKWIIPRNAAGGDGFTWPTTQNEMCAMIILTTKKAMDTCHTALVEGNLKLVNR